MIAALLAGIAIGQTSPAQPTKLWFMFFLRGDGKRPSDPKALEKMQADHIKNLQTQGDAGHLVAAGPLDDPTKLRRGITIAIAKDRAEVESFFKTDPFVKSGIMTVAAAEWERRKLFFSPDYDKKAMEEYELLVTETSLLRESRYRLQNFAVGGATKAVTSEKYRFAGEIWVSRKADHHRLTKALANLDSKYEIIPLWMAKGMIKPTD